MERKNAWKAYSDEQITELEEVNKSYREFLTVGKTERECVKEIIKQAEATGYQSLQSFMEQGRALQKGDKVYAVCMNKSVAMFQIGAAIGTGHEYFRSAYRFTAFGCKAESIV